MTAYHEIFVNTDKSEQALVHDISAAAGATLRHISSINDAPSYRGDLGHSVIELEMAHEFEGVPEMPFEQYSALVTVRDLDADKEREKETAQGIFERLQAIGGYDLLLVFDFQRLLAKS
ncbi:hypothetical protein [Nocardia sp. NPDC051570]|uniref:hypothetical protein n=1 Tax=Nocardia sp. NPDC051570 TaxID=3364324 RepID=UPI0037B8EC8D